ncbi:MAG TPA: serine/threonine-protein kinase [Kofleriaceae bacterium]|jgi:tetratricopeptide (TPR) repeat protein|nr:serine/threonine-protein kinase [Kofleriaceae bacterium]
MITLICPDCGSPNPDLNPRCSRCGGSLPEVSSDTTMPAHHEQVVGSELASQSAMLAARRYRRLTEIARGGSGRIVAARDLVFERSVAIKEPLEPLRDGARLRAEAEILASLQHPSIVPVYDTGVWSDGAPFFAMKLVEGRSLRDAIRDAGTLERRLALIPQLVAVTDAIAYAHVQGVLHRDVKPGNVLIGKFGETVVIDWGLAKRLGALDTTSCAATPDGPGRPRAAIETATGAVLGTPAYMAPEQARGDQVDARADVYALGAMLYHLLAGDPPYHDAAGEAVISAIGAAGPTRIEELQPRAPADLIAIVNKAMARDAAGRYPTASELADDLRRFQTGRLVGARRYRWWTRGRRWLGRRRFGLVAAVATLAIATAALFGVGAIHPSAEVCTGARARLAGAWDLPRRLFATAAFAADRLPYAGATWTRVARRLDDYGDRWAAMHTEACRATRVDGSQSERVLELRMTCLERRRAELAALADQLEHADDAVVEHAIQAAAALAPIDACGDVPQLLARAATHAEPVVAWRRRISEVKALHDVGRWQEGRARAAALVGDADLHADSAVRAEAWGWLGRMQGELDDFSTAEPSLQTALRLAGAAGNDELAAHLVGDLTYVLGQDKGRYDQALIVADLGRSFVARAGDDALLQAELLIARGSVLGYLSRYDDGRAALVDALALLHKHAAADDLRIARATIELASNRSDAGAYAEAQQLYRDAVAMFERELGPDHPKTAQALNNLGILARAMHHYDEAMATYRRALDIEQRVFGADSVTVAHTLNNMAAVLDRTGRVDDAATYYERALAIYEARSGPEHAWTGSTLGNLGVVRREQGRLDEALDLHRRALAIKLKTNGPSSPQVANSHENIGHVLYDRGELAAAEAEYRQAIAITTKVQGVDHPDTLQFRTSLAETLLAESRTADARRELEYVVRTVEAKLGADSGDLVAPLGLLARCELDQGEVAPALATAQRAVTLAGSLARKGDLDPEQLAVVSFELARALWASGGDRRRAEQLAADAERALASPPARRDRARVVAWRRTHHPPA